MNVLEETMRERLKKNQFMSYNHIELEHVEPDYAVFRLDIRPESRNIFGMVHGGALYTMADNAAGSAAHTDGRNYVTQNGSLHFLRNQTEGVKLCLLTKTIKNSTNGFLCFRRKN